MGHSNQHSTFHKWHHHHHHNINRFIMACFLNFLLFYFFKNKEQGFIWQKEKLWWDIFHKKEEKYNKKIKTNFKTATVTKQSRTDVPNKNFLISSTLLGQIISHLVCRSRFQSKKGNHLSFFPISNIYYCYFYWSWYFIKRKNEAKQHGLSFKTNKKEETIKKFTQKRQPKNSS